MRLVYTIRKDAAISNDNAPARFSLSRSCSINRLLCSFFFPTTPGDHSEVIMQLQFFQKLICLHLTLASLSLSYTIIPLWTVHYSFGFWQGQWNPKRQTQVNGDKNISRKAKDQQNINRNHWRQKATKTKWEQKAPANGNVKLVTENPQNEMTIVQTHKSKTSQKNDLAIYCTYKNNIYWGGKKSNYEHEQQTRSIIRHELKTRQPWSLIGRRDTGAEGSRPTLQLVLKTKRKLSRAERDSITAVARFGMIFMTS